MKGGRNCFCVFSFMFIAIFFIFLSFSEMLSIEKQQSITKSIQKLVEIKSECSSAGNMSTPSTVYSSPTPCSLSNNTNNNTVIVKEKPCEREGPWYAQDRLWHYPVLFPRCSMDVCFNYSRCENMNDIQIFTYERPFPPSRYFYGFNTTKWYTSDPNKACLFLAFVDINNKWYRGHPSQLPYWNNGTNHVLVSFSDRWALTKIPMESIGFASLLISDMHETTYRPGFDISIPFPPKIRPKEFQNNKPFARKYLLTFRGLRYLGHHIEGMHRSHESFTNMHNGKDIIVAVTCRHPTNNNFRKWEPSLGANCEEDQAIYNKYNYYDLLNSTFGLAPAGRQPNSYRLAELICAGTIPVLIADNYVKPHDTLIQWHRCILQFPTNQMHRIVPILRKMSKEEAEERQKYCLKIYLEVFKDDKTLLNAAVTSLKARMMGFFPNATGANL